MGGRYWMYLQDMNTTCQRDLIPRSLAANCGAKVRFQPDLNRIKTTPTTVPRFEHHSAGGSLPDPYH